MLILDSQISRESKQLALLREDHARLVENAAREIALSSSSLVLELAVSDLRGLTMKLQPIY